MSDPRTTPFNGRVAHVSLKGLVDAERFEGGRRLMVGSPLAQIHRKPGGPIDRELVFGAAFIALGEPVSPGEEGSPVQFQYGFAERDGYCGWIALPLLEKPWDATHRVSVRQSYSLLEPDLKSPETATPIYHGADVCIVNRLDGWSEIRRPSDAGPNLYIPTAHLRPIGKPEIDPIDVARRFLGTPYLWGGNSGRGMDCSGLIQTAMHACGWTCPGDSDLQAAMPGEHLPETMTLEPGDLIFWEGHVAMATGPDTMIHANAHHMMVIEEPIAPAIARIAETETGPVTLRLRPERRKTPPF